MQKRKLVVGFMALLGFFVFTHAASALEQSSWDFTDVRDAKTFFSRGNGVDVATVPEGLLLTARSEGWLLKEIDLPHSIDAVVFTVQAPKDTPMQLVWHVPGTPESPLLQFPFAIPATKEGAELAPVALDLSYLPAWDRDLDKLGIIFPEGGQILLQGAELRSWNVFEKTYYAWRSFWTFDAWKTRTVNFLWGPLLTFTPVGRMHLHDTVVPGGTSANGVLHWMLGLCAMLLFVGKKVQRRRVVLVGFLGVVSLWLLYDLRMGMEFVSWVQHDRGAFVSAAPEERVFRELDRFYPFADRVASATEGEAAYALLTEKPYPTTGLLRYFTYPSIPRSPKESAKLATWVVYKHSGATVDESGMLRVFEEQIAGPGEITDRFSQHSFIFHVTE